jgi:hypothetical protein
VFFFFFFLFFYYFRIEYAGGRFKKGTVDLFYGKCTGLNTIHSADIVPAAVLIIFGFFTSEIC